MLVATANRKTIMTWNFVVPELVLMGHSNFIIFSFNLFFLTDMNRPGEDRLASCCKCILYFNLKEGLISST
jgi:hypothetical protein